MKLFGLSFRGKSYKLELKVLRNELAKEFPLIGIAKDGDVGLDIPATLPYQSGWKTAVDDYHEQCMNMNEEPDQGYLNELIHGYITINPGERHLIPTGIKLEIPKGYWASIEARSSTSKQSLIVPKGVIDEGYRGELFAQILNVGNESVTIHHGDRLIQLLLHERVIQGFSIKEVDSLSASLRGETGFGSSGQSSLKIK
jgi:dUTP pyrophosphatase